jgi:Tol biopolymer transport system component
MRRLVVRALVVASLSACGRIGFDLVGHDGAIAVDALGPWGTPVPLTSINSPDVDVDPSLTADGLQLFFCSNRGGSLDVYVSMRAGIDDPWPAPTRVDEVSNLFAIEQDSVISADGLTLYFTRNGSIFQATRTSPSGTFGTATAIGGELETTGNNVVSSVTPDQLAMTLSSTRPGGQGASDIYLATRPDLGAAWSVEPVPGPINGPDTDSDSFLTADRLTLYFDTNRGGEMFANFKIYVATRASVSEPFGEPVPVSELDVAAAQGDLWLSADGRYGLFAAGPSLTELDIYEVRR